MVLALRVDVDTHIGMHEGVPRLLDLFRRLSIQASFFVTFGPDRSGRALRRLFQPAFIMKMLRTNPFRLYGLRTLLSGTLLPSRPVGESAPGLLKTIVAQGHEVGIHGYDHVLWQDSIETMEECDVREELDRARSAYQRILGAQPLSSAAPGWRSTEAALNAQDQLGLLYASDVRGTAPFIPVNGSREFKTLQIPTTLPTLDELLGRQRKINDLLLSLLEHEINVHTVHAEVEGKRYLPLLEDFLVALNGSRVPLVRLCDVAREILRAGAAELPRRPIKRCRIRGRAGWVSCQDNGANDRFS